MVRWLFALLMLLAAGHVHDAQALDLREDCVASLLITDTDSVHAPLEDKTIDTSTCNDKPKPQQDEDGSTWNLIHAGEGQDAAWRLIGHALGHELWFIRSREVPDPSYNQDLYVMRRSGKMLTRVMAVMGGANCQGGISKVDAQADKGTVTLERSVNAVALLVLLYGEEASGLQLDAFDDGLTACLADVTQTVNITDKTTDISRMVLRAQLPLRDGVQADSCLGSALREVAGEDNVISGDELDRLRAKLDGSCIAQSGIRTAGRYARGCNGDAACTQDKDYTEVSFLKVERKPEPGQYHFSLYAAAGKVNGAQDVGQLQGDMTLAAAIGSFQQDSCKLGFAFQPKGVNITQDGSPADCKAPAGVKYAGFYGRDD
ncbi:hypothetical protein GC177_05830 [bacterium]|nr:hypothetical protein [bacterium]